MGKQPCRAITWWAHRDDDRRRDTHPVALPSHFIGSIDPDALKNPRPNGGILFSNNGFTPFSAEPRQMCSKKNAFCRLVSIVPNERYYAPIFFSAVNRLWDGFCCFGGTAY